ncbi:MAG: hypothetical protein K8F25_16800 [Fimbriimonadaceae bacterium]|nr:hypothetical protein [Alphaproteobacteria bacterium]
MSRQDDFESLRGRIISQVQAIPVSHPCNLMARHFNEFAFAKLSGKHQKRFLKIIRSGLENPDSEMGAYARHADDYQDFQVLLDPMIRDYHNLPGTQTLDQQHDWPMSDCPCDLAAIDPDLRDVSMRVRVGRNVADFPLPAAMTKMQRLEFEALMTEAFATLQRDPAFGGQYLSLSPGSRFEIDDAEFTRRVRAHQMFRDMRGDPYLASAGISADWPFGRGMYVSDAQDFIVWVGEEDHLRVMAMNRGGDLAGLFSRLHDGLERLGTVLPLFAHSDRYGYLTSCPTNLGTAMRASLLLSLPKLTEGGDDPNLVKEAASQLGLAVRGMDGEHSKAGRGGLVDISPRARMGITEREIMHRLYDGVATLWAQEKSAP